MTIKAIYIPSQTDVDFFARNAADQWWNTSGTPVFEAYNPANLASYRIAATESPAGSGIYAADEPTGTVEFELRVRAATLADSVIVAGPAKTDAAESATLISAIKADADLGTADGGMVANVARILALSTTGTAGVIGTEYITITRNDTVSFSFTVTTDYTGYTGLLTIRHRVTEAQLMQVAVTVTSATVLSVSLSSTDTAFPLLVSLTEFGPHPFDIQMTSGATVNTPVTGIAVVQRDQTT